MSGNGHVGSATAAALLDRGEAVTVLVRDTVAAERLRARGAVVVTADASDEESLRRAFRSGRRALLVNPPADPSGDTDQAEHRTVDTILRALEGSGLEKVVAVSTYGAQAGDGIGDLGTLWRLEQGLVRQSIPAAINRHAYSMTNWNAYLPLVLDQGVLPSALPGDLRLPMVAPADLGAAAADRLRSSVEDARVLHVEGPDRYTPADVASAFATALDRPVALHVTPLDQLEQMFTGIGFSETAASSYAELTRRTVHGLHLPDDPRRGATSLHDHVAARADEHRASSRRSRPVDEQ
ncbi:NAD(P)H-binding protein [Rathayibacter oskolensis]|nr:NAD(P)H-binding protein [Rathayibacter oskolensis]